MSTYTRWDSWLRNRVRDTAQSVYDNTLRPLTPERPISCNGVTVPVGRLLDAQWYYRDYKDAQVSALRKHVKHTDDVLVVGGGYGVTAVVAAQRAKSVHLYEAAADVCELVERVADLNGVSDRLEINHATIGEAVNARGGELGPVVDPDALSSFDVIELDCEGPESELVPALTPGPRVVVLEIHPQFGANVREIKDHLLESGYRVTERYDDPDKPNVTITAVNDD